MIIDKGNDSDMGEETGSKEEELAEKLEWFRSSDDVRSGYIRCMMFGPKEVKYSVIDGLAVFVGDIAIGKIYELDQQSQDVDLDQLSARGIAYRVGITMESFPVQVDDPLAHTQINKSRKVNLIARTLRCFPVKGFILLSFTFRFSFRYNFALELVFKRG